MRDIVASVELEFRRYRQLAEGALRQLDDQQLAARAAHDGNSIATLAWHVAGNLRSRFTDFLESDGEKPWRDRDSEFTAHEKSRDELMTFWANGWSCLFDSLAQLDDSHLSRQVTIRSQPLGIHEALHRSLAHAAYHVGQIVMTARAHRGDDWQFMSIPPGQSAAYNQNPTLEKSPRVDED